MHDSYVLFLYAAAISIAGMSLLAGYIAEVPGSSSLKGWTFLPKGLPHASLSLIFAGSTAAAGKCFERDFMRRCIG